MRHILPAKPARLAAAALVAFSTQLAHAGVSTWKPATNFEAGGTAEVADGKVYKDDRPGFYLVDLPSYPTMFLIDTPAMTAFAVRREDVETAKNGFTVKVRERFAWSAPVSWITSGVAFSFPIGGERVEVHRIEPPTEAAAAKPTSEPANEAGKTGRKEGAPSPPGSVPEQAPAGIPATGPEARECVSLESRPATGVPGCTRFVYVKNSCDAAVVAYVQRTEHLMTGALPQAFDTVVPPGERWIGCSWWSGAMAPAKHELLGAAYLEPPGKVAHGRRGTTAPR
jgi:hypothetical protein